MSRPTTAGQLLLADIGHAVEAQGTAGVLHGWTRFTNGEKTMMRLYVGLKPESVLLEAGDLVEVAD